MLAPSTTEVVSADADAARAAVEEVRAELPYPDDVIDCVAVKASQDAEILKSLQNLDDEKEGTVAREASAACVLEVRSGPRFAEDLQRSAGGSLSDPQLACAAREYGKLDPEQVEAAAGAVLNPEKAEDSATAPVEKIYKTCGIERDEN